MLYGGLQVVQSDKGSSESRLVDLHLLEETASTP